MLKVSLECLGYMAIPLSQYFSNTKRLYMKKAILYSVMWGVLREDVSSHSTFDGKVKILDLAAVQVCSTWCKNKHFCKVWDKNYQNPLF